MSVHGQEIGLKMTAQLYNLKCSYLNGMEKEAPATYLDKLHNFSSHIFTI